MITEHDVRRTFATGAVRSSDADGVRFDLISPIGLRRLAETCAEGAAKYGERNWEKGFPASTLLNHALRHVNLWLAATTARTTWRTPRGPCWPSCTSRRPTPI